MHKNAIQALVLISQASITNHHKYNGLKQHTLILFFQFWRSEVRNQSYWAKVKCWQGWFFLEVSEGENQFVNFFSFQKPPVFVGLWFLTSSSKPAVQHFQVLNPLHLLFLDPPPHLHFMGTFVMALVPSGQSKLTTHLKVLCLVTFPKFLLLREVNTCMGFKEQDVDIFEGPLFCLPQPLSVESFLLENCEQAAHTYTLPQQSRQFGTKVLWLFQQPQVHIVLEKPLQSVLTYWKEL